MQQLDRCERIAPFRELKFANGSPDGTFAGYGAVYGNVDSYGDVIAQNAASESLREWKERGKFPPMLLQHGGGFMGGALDMSPVGQWTDMVENSKGLKVEGRLFAMNTDRSQLIYEGLKSGELDGLSIGFNVREMELGTKPGEPPRTLTNIELWEVSIVTFPANPKARISSVKSLTPDELRDIENSLRDAGLSRTDRLKAISVLKQLLRDAGAPVITPRDADVTANSETEEQKIERWLREHTDRLLKDVFRR